MITKLKYLFSSLKRKPGLEAFVLVGFALFTTYLIYILNQEGEVRLINPFFGQSIDRLFYIVFFSIGSWFAYVNYRLNRQKVSNEISRDQYNFFLTLLANYKPVVQFDLHVLRVKSTDLHYLYNTIIDTVESEEFNRYKLRHELYQIEELLKVWYSDENELPENQLTKIQRDINDHIVSVKELNNEVFEFLLNFDIKNDQMQNAYNSKVLNILEVDEDRYLSILDKQRLLKKLFDNSILSLIEYVKSSCLFKFRFIPETGQYTATELYNIINKDLACQLESIAKKYDVSLVNWE